ncbi:MAG: FemAB family PEP-CTERM system-associated protein [Ectothiorhodospiraceae bacterium]|nr:FemAB family PEP-CTERM system-associated protein [Ectothiorhodospiraceae bacterium]
MTAGTATVGNVPDSVGGGATGATGAALGASRDARSGDAAVVRELAAADWPAWDAFVAGHRLGTLYHRQPWLDVVRGHFGHTVHCLAAWRGASLVGALPLVRLRSRLFGDYLVSIPFVNYGGALAEDDAALRALLDATGDLATSLGVTHAELRHTEPVELDGFTWPVRTEKVVMVRELPDDPDALLKSLGAKVRSQVKRPQREGAVAVRGGAELLDDFYRVFAENMRDLGTPVYAKGFFRAILDRLGAAASIVVIRVGGEPAAAGFLIGDGDRLEIPWASSLRRHNRIGVNMALYGDVLRFAVESGYARFDFGRSTRDSNTYRFKRQWGAVEQPLNWYYWLAPGRELPRLDPSNPKYALAIRAWQHLPLPVANLIGPHLVRNLP